MKRIYSLAAALALTAMANGAGAMVITDTKTFGPDGGAGTKLDFLESVSWTHNFSAPGTINSGVLSVSLSDDQLWDGIEIGLGITDSGQWAVGLVSTDTYSYDVSVSSLLDGSLSVTLYSLWGDFFLKSSSLSVYYTPGNGKVTSTPEPATLSLMGIGILGAAFGYRRRVKKA